MERIIVSEDELEPVAEHPNEPPSIIISDEKMVQASRFKKKGIALVTQRAGFTDIEQRRLVEMYDLCETMFDQEGHPPRDTGERYFNHTKAVALIDTIELGSRDPDKFVAALQHDTLENLSVFAWNIKHSSLDQLTKVCGRRAAKMINALTKPRYPKAKGSMTPEEMDAFLLEATRRVIYRHPDIAKEAAEIKVADGIANMRTVNKADPARTAKQIRKCIMCTMALAEFAGEQYYEALRRAIYENRGYLPLSMSNIQQVKLK